MQSSEKSQRAIHIYTRASTSYFREIRQLFHPYFINHQFLVSTFNSYTLSIFEIFLQTLRIPKKPNLLHPVPWTMLLNPLLDQTSFRTWSDPALSEEKIDRKISEHTKSCPDIREKKKKKTKTKQRDIEKGHKKDDDSSTKHEERHANKTNLRPGNLSIHSSVSTTSPARRQSISVTVSSSNFRRQSSTTPSPDGFYLSSREGSPIGNFYGKIPSSSYRIVDRPKFFILYLFSVFISSSFYIISLSAEHAPKKDKKKKSKSDKEKKGLIDLLIFLHFSFPRKHLT